MMQYEQSIRDWYKGKEKQFVDVLNSLVEIPSVKGPETARVLSAALKVMETAGFSTINHENIVGTADMNDEETILHILGHLDIVDAGDGWTRNPFSVTNEEGMLYGRGVSDDKGPVVAAMMAMMCIKDLGIPLKKNVRLLMGTDEECGSSDIAWYFARNPHAPNTFTPDADFPVVNIEKGTYSPQFKMSWENETFLPRVIAFDGGFRLNVIPGVATAKVLGLFEGDAAEAAAKVQENTGATFKFKNIDGGLEITCLGKQAHASTPENGINAITALLEMLSTLNLKEGASTNALRSLNALFPHADNHGKALGIDLHDDISGYLTCAFTILKMDENGIEGKADCRTALCANEDNCKRVAESNLKARGFVVDGTLRQGHHTPSETPFVQALLRCYENYTNLKGECLAIGGGTYVHNIPGGVAFGCGMPGFDSNMHGADEHIPLADLMISSQMFAQVIVEMCC